jgi:hypothetical protein
MIIPVRRERGVSTIDQVARSRTGGMRLLPFVAAAVIATATGCGQSAQSGAVLAPDPPGALGSPRRDEC